MLPAAWLCMTCLLKKTSSEKADLVKAARWFQSAPAWGENSETDSVGVHIPDAFVERLLLLGQNDGSSLGK